MSAKERDSKIRQSSLGLRLLTIVGLALLPVAALNIWQGIERIRLDQTSVRETLRHGALTAANEERVIFAAAEEFLRSLVKEDDIRLGTKACQNHLEDAARGMAAFGNLARVSAKGAILCAAIPPPSNFDVTKFPWWDQALVRREFFVGGPYYSDALRRNVFAGVLPLVGADGAFDGTFNVAINIDWLTLVNERQRKLPPGSVVALFDKSGSIVASNAPGIAATVFAGSTELQMGNDGMRSARGPNDVTWSLMIAPVLQNDHYIGFAMRDSDLTRLSYIYVAVDLLLPVLMIALASLAIWWGTHRHILCWTDMLREMAVDYAAGNYATRPQALSAAPSEFRELGDILSYMAAAVGERDHSLKEALAQKDLLIREIHHRVKNSLQIVVSLLRLQSNSLQDATSREVLAQARARVDALAHAHRAIYDFGFDGSIDLKLLMTDAVEQVQRAEEDSHKQVTLSVDVASCRVSSDAAVPLLLFVNEALTNAYQHGYKAADAAGHISVSLKPASNSQMDLMIANDGDSIDNEPDRPQTGIGVSLMTAFARQVSGKMSMQSSDKGGTVVTLNFPVLSQAAE